MLDTVLLTGKQLYDRQVWIAMISAEVAWGRKELLAMPLIVTQDGKRTVQRVLKPDEPLSKLHEAL